LKTFQTAHMFPILMEIKDMSEDWQVTRRSALSPGRNSPLFRGEWWTSVCPVQCRPRDFTKVLIYLNLVQTCMATKSWQRQVPKKMIVFSIIITLMWLARFANLHAAWKQSASFGSC
jgi:hypothetical protein